MTPVPPAVRRFYAALDGADARGILAVLHPAFIARFSAGLPLNAGGVYRGPEATMNDGWVTVYTAFDIRPVPEEYLVVDPERVIVLGAYRGTARATGRPIEAAFAHDLTLRDDLIAGLTQITDTQMWHQALANAGE